MDMNKPQFLSRAVLGKVLLIMAGDVVATMLSFFLGLWFRYDFSFQEIRTEHLQGFLSDIGPWCVITIVVFLCFRLYSSIWAFVSTSEVFRIAGAYLVLAVIGGILLGKAGKKKGAELDDIYREVALELKREAEAEAARQEASRALEGDPQANWAAHNKDIHDRRDYLNSLHIRQLRYRSATGTDFTVGMIPEGRFCGGSEKSLQGIVFNPNIPSEECFISPKRGEAEGIVYSSKPLSYQGQLIEDFSIRFEHGRAVEVHARTNEALLQKLIAMDDGAAYLGECALVPYDSPIRNSGIMFYNTLFDENAACHLALGDGFTGCIKDYENYTLEQCREMGINNSMVHEDFMIGTPDLEITAHCRDGRTVPVFRNGTWAF
mgnify:CR=1 FL=1